VPGVVDHLRLVVSDDVAGELGRVRLDGRRQSAHEDEQDEQGTRC
jgi:hypothetical protein